MLKASIHIICFLLLAISVQAQYNFHNYKRVDIEDGLPSRVVFDIAEDKYGFIWVATTEGLARYDGNSACVVEKQVSDTYFLQSNDIPAILADGDSLWVGTRKGLSILNLNSGEIHNPDIGPIPIESGVDAEDDNAYTVWDIHKDRQGNIWFSPNYGGFVKWERSTQQFRHFPLPQNAKKPYSYFKADQTTLRVILQDVNQDSIIWGGGLAGLLRLNQETGQITRIFYSGSDEERQYLVNRKICMHQEPDGIIYTGSWNGGLSIYNPATSEYSFPSIEMPQMMPKAVHRDHLFKIIPGMSGHLYLTYYSGLYDYDIQNKDWQLIKVNKFKGENQIEYGIEFIDSKQRAWYGSSYGVLMVDPLVHQFKWHSLAEFNPTATTVIIRALVEGFYPGHISVAGQYTDGVYHVNPTNGHTFKSEFKEYMAKNKFFASWGMIQLDENRLLITGGNKLYTWNKLSEQFQAYDIQIPITYSNLNHLTIDNQKVIWLGSSRDGLFSIDTKQGTVTSYKDQIPFLQVFKQFKDKQENIWAIGGHGHLVFDRCQNKFHFFEYNKDASVTFLYGQNFCECPNGEIWLSGREDGIGLLSSEQLEKGIIKKRRILNEKGEVVVIQKLACSLKNELWAVDKNGLYKIDRQHWKAEIFSRDYGLKRWNGTLQFLDTGELFIGSRDGFYTIKPEELLKNNNPPKPYVSSIITIKGIKNKLEDHLHQRPVYLSPKEKVITIEFSAINHILASKTQFAYQLEGIDEDWVNPGSKRTITYSYLPGGDYTFKLKAANNEGVWNEKAYQLPINIGIPWYQSSLFLIGLAVLILGLAYYLYNLRIQQIQKANALKSEFERRVADLEMNALRTQMNPHFIFNCLNSIEAYIIRNDTKKASEYLNTFGRLVRLILQNSRSAYVSLQDELHSIKLYLELEQMRFKNNFDYEIILTNNLRPEEYEIPPMLIQPFVENAIWHGLNPKEEGGSVKIEISHFLDNLQCIIEDNGIGRVAAQKIRAAQRIKRKSMGMQITMDRIKTLNKIYSTKNEVKIKDLYDSNGVAAGTRVTITIPF